MSQLIPNSHHIHKSVTFDVVWGVQLYMGGRCLILRLLCLQSLIVDALQRHGRRHSQESITLIFLLSQRLFTMTSRNVEWGNRIPDTEITIE